jgi:DNA-directed RNA polymerase subunit RPC12/RpoP
MMSFKCETCDNSFLESGMDFDAQMCKECASCLN